ncbi:hypothetical protein ACFX10_042405 [Malus domestica]
MAEIRFPQLPSARFPLVVRRWGPEQLELTLSGRSETERSSSQHQSSLVDYLSRWCHCCCWVHSERRLVIPHLDA